MNTEWSPRPESINVSNANDISPNCPALSPSRCPPPAAAPTVTLPSFAPFLPRFPSRGPVRISFSMALVVFVLFQNIIYTCIYIGLFWVNVTLLWVNVELSFERIFFGPPELRFQQTRFYFHFCWTQNIYLKIYQYIYRLFWVNIALFFGPPELLFQQTLFDFNFCWTHNIYKYIYGLFWENDALFFGPPELRFRHRFFFKYPDLTHSHRKNMGLLRSCHYLFRFERTHVWLIYVWHWSFIHDVTPSHVTYMRVSGYGVATVRSIN